MLPHSNIINYIQKTLKPKIAPSVPLGSNNQSTNLLPKITKGNEIHQFS